MLNLVGWYPAEASSSSSHLPVTEEAVTGLVIH